VKPPVAAAMSDCAPRETEVQKLAAGDDSILQCRELVNRSPRRFGI
jgi:hypothetical protein